MSSTLKFLVILLLGVGIGYKLPHKSISAPTQACEETSQDTVASTENQISPFSSEGSQWKDSYLNYLKEANKYLRLESLCLDETNQDVLLSIEGKSWKTSLPVGKLERTANNKSEICNLAKSSQRVTVDSKANPMEVLQKTSSIKPKK